MQKPAEVRYKIMDLLQNRWSPRAFSAEPVGPDKLARLFEAARWSPSAANIQPWAFIVTERGSNAHQKLVSTLTGRNSLWAPNAPVLVLALAKLSEKLPARYSYYDLGQSVAHLSVQATSMGLEVHQMGGFMEKRVSELFELPENVEPVTVIAIGYAGRAEDLHEDLRAREADPRSRKALDEFVFGEEWNEPLALPEAETPVTVGTASAKVTPV